MDASTVTLAVAGLAVIVGIVVAVDLVRTRPRNAARARHPSTAPPLTITLGRSSDGAHWRVDLPAGRATTSVDIVTYRPIGSSTEWESEPIVEPIELHPGGWALLPSVVGDPSTPHELVVAWTVHGSDAAVTGSGRFVVDDGHAVAAQPVAVPDRTWVVAGVFAIALLVIAGGLVVRELVRSSGDAVGEVAGGATGAPTVPTSLAAPTTPSVASMALTIPTSPVVPSTSPDASPEPTSTTTPMSTSTTSTSVPASTTVPDGPSVAIAGRVEDCRFGPQCLIAGFTIERFDDQPGEYVCEFSDGSRVTFKFGGSGVETACSQTGPNPSITIEVDGVRSDTITRDTVS